MHTDEINQIQKKHISVLLHELVDSIYISSNKKNIIVDCTLGMGGHAEKIIEKMNPGDIFIGFDADSINLELAKQRLADTIKHSKIESHFILSNFVHLKSELQKRNINNITGIYYDLGISSLHVDEAERGFSFKLDGPLDMRFDKRSGKTAADIVNGYTQKELRHIFLKYGEEGWSNKIAEKIVESRRKKKFETTKELTTLIEGVTKHQKTKNKIFQALRIETNKELENIETSVMDAIDILEKGGRIFVISFHSLEDRIIKNIFRQESRNYINDEFGSHPYTKKLDLWMKKPIIPQKQEIERNQRSRSAKARLAEKI